MIPPYVCHQLLSPRARYERIQLSYLVGFAAPLPFWLVHRHWPKLRADYLYPPIIWYALNSRMTDLPLMFASFSMTINWLWLGITLRNVPWFIIAFIFKRWMRTRHPPGSRDMTTSLPQVRFSPVSIALRRSCNLVALGGDTQVIVFVLSFAVQGAAGFSYPFPTWWA